MCVCVQRELEEEIEKLEKSQQRLARCEEELKEIDSRVADLKTEFAGRTAEAERCVQSKLDKNRREGRRRAVRPSETASVFYIV